MFNITCFYPKYSDALVDYDKYEKNVVFINHFNIILQITVIWWINIINCFINTWCVCYYGRLTTHLRNKYVTLIMCVYIINQIWMQHFQTLLPAFLLILDITNVKLNYLYSRRRPHAREDHKLQHLLRKRE